MTKPARGGVALGGFAVLILGGELRDVVMQALSLMRSSLLQAAFSDLWLLVIQIWMQSGPHSDLWVIIWLLSLGVLGFASIRRALVHALIGLFGPRMPWDGGGERTPLFSFRRACQGHFCEDMMMFNTRSHRG
jgi:hypothetical protein